MFIPRKKTNKSRKLRNLKDKRRKKEPHRQMKRGIIKTTCIITTYASIRGIKQLRISITTNYFNHLSIKIIWNMAL
jgi:hypothetical protein